MQKQNKTTLEKFKNIPAFVTLMFLIAFNSKIKAQETAQEINTENQPKITVKYSSEYNPAITDETAFVMRDLKSLPENQPLEISAQPIISQPHITETTENKNQFQEWEEDISRGAKKVENLKEDIEGDLNLEFKGSKIIKSINTDSPNIEAKIGYEPKNSEGFFSLTKKF